uniref:EamA domain-containing protein n=1 Tax=Chaetoceros debilis TaxID=122233 RepID=A0A7S3PV94_9STRA|mmetsp:Transcript_4116/g.6064  ORF Transcript_4116/g.6064 Transcript_4116/m.6064 type:complete len:479 (+) Transcript_4116:183-1619(+)|eukprot:CAMPEP_0194081234 /NCGR_PEP_ID=MMETSP0149-20130528/7081_1 /TAXON_ID=122233 /ORGANISM="Chaetoceros debilis, Strain MM31A-1" /LENGTH=478 /DNA_ID=CAMNT_0038763119 /DNA_START=133 /DNA_END=1569 /DNA_ORIENTATION=+
MSYRRNNTTGAYLLALMWLSATPSSAFQIPSTRQIQHSFPTKTFIIGATKTNIHDISSSSSRKSRTQIWSTTEQTKIEESKTKIEGEEEEFYTDENGVICARGVCVIAEEVSPETCKFDEDLNEVVCEINDNAEKVVQPGFTIDYLWPRALLLVCSVLYGTNFPLGRLMNDALPASGATSTRMLLATIALSPFLFQLKPSLRKPAAVCGTFTALGYISQSIALVDTPAATVSFLGALVVIVCPALAVLVDKKKMGFSDAPQTWIAAITCLLGVGVLELGGGGGLSGADIGAGDVWSVLQAVGFGTSFFVTERMMAKEPSQALPITAMQCGMSAAFAGIWAALDGTGAFNGALAFGSPHGAWLLDETLRSSFTLPGLFFDDNMRNVALAAAFTGFITTAGNRVGETVALGKLSSSEASVLLATEPLWAAVFASFLINEQLSINDGIGGAMIVAACVATAIDPVWLRTKLGIDYAADDKN